MSEKKVVNRNVAIALGIMCILLANGLVGTIAVYTPMIDNKSNTIAIRDLQIAELNSQIADKNNTILSLISQISSLQTQNNHLNDSLNQANALLGKYLRLNVMSIPISVIPLNITLFTFYYSNGYKNLKAIIENDFSDQTLYNCTLTYTFAERMGSWGHIDFGTIDSKASKEKSGIVFSETLLLPFAYGFDSPITLNP
jgi:hypothetical protein